MDRNLIRSCSDIFHLDEASLSSLERMGPKSSKNLVAAIRASRRLSLSRFIYSLGIRHVGENIADILAKRFETLERLMNAPQEQLEQIDGIGVEIAGAVSHFFSQDENREAVRRLLERGIPFEMEEERTTGLLDGKIFVLTGTLATMTRSEAKNLIEASGGKVTGTVSRRTDYLLAGSDPGSKLARARDIGVTIIDESDLQKMLSLRKQETRLH